MCCHLCCHVPPVCTPVGLGRLFSRLKSLIRGGGAGETPPGVGGTAGLDDIHAIDMAEQAVWRQLRALGYEDPEKPYMQQQLDPPAPLKQKSDPKRGSGIPYSMLRLFSSHGDGDTPPSGGDSGNPLDGGKTTEGGGDGDSFKSHGVRSFLRSYSFSFSSPFSSLSSSPTSLASFVPLSHSYPTSVLPFQVETASGNKEKGLRVVKNGDVVRQIGSRSIKNPSEASKSSLVFRNGRLRMVEPDSKVSKCRTKSLDEGSIFSETDSKLSMYSAHSAERGIKIPYHSSPNQFNGFRSRRDSSVSPTSSLPCACWDVDPSFFRHCSNYSSRCHIHHELPANQEILVSGSNHKFEAPTSANHSSPRSRASHKSPANQSRVATSRVVGTTAQRPECCSFFDTTQMLRDHPAGSLVSEITKTEKNNLYIPTHRRYSFSLFNDEKCSSSPVHTQKFGSSVDNSKSRKVHPFESTQFSSCQDDLYVTASNDQLSSSSSPVSSSTSSSSESSFHKLHENRSIVTGLSTNPCQQLINFDKVPGQKRVFDKFCLPFSLSRSQSVPARVLTRRSSSSFISQSTLECPSASSMSQATSHQVPLTSQSVSLFHQVPLTSQSVSLFHQIPLTSQSVSSSHQVPLTSQSVSASHQVPLTSQSVSHQVPLTSQSFSVSHQIPLTSQSVSASHQVPLTSQSVSVSHFTRPGQLPRPLGGTSPDKDALLLRLEAISSDRRRLESSSRRGLLRRCLVYPLGVLVLVVVTGVVVVLVVFNVLQLISGFKSLPHVLYKGKRTDSENAMLGKRAVLVWLLGPLGAVVEVVLVLYLFAASLVGCYSLPPMRGVSPVVGDTPMVHLLLNCVLLLVLASALPLLSTTLGLTNLDLLGDYGSVGWLGSLWIVLSYNLLFASAALWCLVHQFSSAVRGEMYARLGAVAEALLRRYAAEETTGFYGSLREAFFRRVLAATTRYKVKRP